MASSSTDLDSNEQNRLKSFLGEKARDFKSLEVEDQVTKLIIGSRIIWPVGIPDILLDTEIQAYSGSNTQEKSNVVGKYYQKKKN